MDSSLATTSVTIKAFQSIDDLSFDISGFTCVTGPSNIGKSAIVRAISGALLNSSATSFVRKGRKFCSVDLRAPGWGIKWEKGDRVGRYWIPGEDAPRDGIGQGQTEMTSSLGFRSIKIGDEKLSPWFAPQFSPVFLLDKSGPSITDFISDITRLKVLQDGIVLNVKTRQRALTEAAVKDEDTTKLLAVEEKLSAVDQLAEVEKDLVAQMESVRKYEEGLSYLRQTLVSLEREGASVRSLSAVKRVSVPDEVPPPQIARMVGIWDGLEAAAISVAALRGAPSVPVPEPDEEAAKLGDSLGRALRFLDIEGLAASVAAMEPVGSVPVPDPADDSLLAKIREGSLLMQRLRSAESSLTALSGDLPEVPGEPDDSGLKSLSAVAVILRSWDEEHRAIADLGSQHDELHRQSLEVEAELARIPTCVTCGQVVAPAHEHA